LAGKYKKIAKSFFDDEKEVVEHTMLIDLERNDLGRICEVGSVKVTEKMALEKYTNLMHIVTTIRGNLPADKDSFDLVRSMFPGGTVTGCPKIRTMEIIDELEPVARGPYTGSIGFISPSDECQFNIIIRTLVIDKTKRRGYVQVGGGIVADSNAEYEYKENLTKGKAIIDAML
jgi:para-aminobenzoate synthetase component 1